MTGRKPTRQEVIVRPVHPDDAVDLYAIVSHPAVARTLLQLPSMEVSETFEWIKKKQPGRHRLVADAQGRVVGSGSITQFQNPRLAHAGALGLMVHPDYWGQGIGSALMTALLDLADKWLNLQRVELSVFTDNEGAIHLYQKFGFVIEGRRRMVAYGDGRWLDDYVMARLRN